MYNCQCIRKTQDIKNSNSISIQADYFSLRKFFIINPVEIIGEKKKNWARNRIWCWHQTIVTDINLSRKAKLTWNFSTIVGGTIHLQSLFHRENVDRTSYLNFLNPTTFQIIQEGSMQLEPGLKPAADPRGGTTGLAALSIGSKHHSKTLHTTVNTTTRTKITKNKGLAFPLVRFWIRRCRTLK